MCEMHLRLLTTVDMLMSLLRVYCVETIICLGWDRVGLCIMK